MSAEVRVFLCEDDPRLRARLHKLLEAAPGLAVIGEAGSAEEALEALPGAQPDVLLLDLELPGILRGLDRVRLLSGPRPSP